MNQKIILEYFKPIFQFLAVVFIALLIGGTVKAECKLFPANNVWNTPIDKLPVHQYSDKWIANMGAGGELHTDFAAGKWENKEIGIPVNYVKGNYYSAFYKFLYALESDNVKYAVNPATGDAGIKIEEGSDRHMIAVDEDTCMLYELFNTREKDLEADSGARFDLRSNAMRTMGWTSADAAGLPILPGLVRYEEVKAGAINHAIRFTVSKTWGSTWPGSHSTSGETGKVYDFRPPLGARFRLKANYDISSFDAQLQPILKAMKIYGVILADNGADWYLSGAPDLRWNDEKLADIGRIRGNAFEAVDQTCMMVEPNSYAANLSKCLPAAPITPKAVTPAVKLPAYTITLPYGIKQFSLTVKVAP